MMISLDENMQDDLSGVDADLSGVKDDMPGSVRFVVYMHICQVYEGVVMCKLLTFQTVISCYPCTGC